MPLSKRERDQLTRHETTLRTAATWAVREAQALREIRDARLYRDGFQTFEAYCQERWGYERAHAYRLCSWAEAIANLSPNGDSYPTRESHARPLYGLTPDEQRRVWKLHEKRKGKTADDVWETAREVRRSRYEAKAVPEKLAGSNIVEGDAREAVETLDDDTVDLVCFSPPYCEQRKSHYPGIPEERYPDWMATLMGNIRPKIKSTGNVLIVAREHLRDGQISDVWLRTRLAVRALGYVECETLVWHAPDKPPLGRSDRPRRVWESVYWFAPSSSPYVDLRATGKEVEAKPRDREDRWVKGVFERGTGYTSPRPGDRAKVTDLIVAPVGSIPRDVDHPAMYPPGLADQLVRTFSPVGGLVVDPCCGSGTTLLAAQHAGRRWWGSEIVPKYVKLARSRLRARTSTSTRAG